MRRLFQIMIPAAAVLASALTACDGSPSKPVLPSTGVAVGVVYLDRNGNGAADSNDSPAPNVKVSLVVPGSRAEVAHAVSNATGTYAMLDVPVGRYQVLVDSTTIGDTLRVTKIDSAAVTVGAHDSTRCDVALGYPTGRIADIRKLPAGRKVQLQAIALNNWTAFGDSTINVTDATGAIRAVRVIPNVLSLAGDSMRLVGTVSTRDGQVVLTNVAATVISSGSVAPTPTVLTTNAAARANGGALDAALVQIKGATVLTTRIDFDGSFLATVDDGSGILTISIAPRSASITVPNTFVPGAALDATGVLIPAATGGTWLLRPRATADISASFRTRSIADARNETVGRIVQVEGIALNGFRVFSDTAVHVFDPTGSLRMVFVHQVTLFAGDSVRMIGTVAMQNGQVVLSNVLPQVLATGRIVPPPRSLKTSEANTALNGALDAALIQVSSAVVKQVGSETPTGNFAMQVDDGSGTVLVVVDRSLGLATSRYTVGTTLDITGLLVPAAGGATWVIKPRGGADLLVK